MKVKFLITFTYILIKCAGIYADERINQSEVKLALRQNFAFLEKESKPLNNKKLDSILNEISSNIKIINIYNLELSQSFLETLSFNASQLNVASSNKNLNEKIEILTEVNNDLKLKTDSLTESKNFSNSSLNDVKVVVNVLEGKSKVSGFDIECSPRRFNKDGKSMFTFPKLTPDSTFNLPPGIYTFWILKQGKKIKSKDAEIAFSDDLIEIQISWTKKKD